MVHASFPSMLAALTLRIFLRELRRRDFFEELRRETRRIFFDELERERRRRRLFLAHDGARIFFPLRVYTPLRYEHLRLRLQSLDFLVAHLLPRYVAPVSMDDHGRMRSVFESMS
jgi:hypothetical protein